MAARIVLLGLVLVQHVCVAQDGTMLVRKVNEIVANLQNPQNGVQQYTMPGFTVGMSKSPELNAWALVDVHTVLVTETMVRVLYRDPGELAFVIAHEIGHIQDAGCNARNSRLGLRGVALQRSCEAAADQIGMQYLLAAGYSPFDAAGLMGKLLMADPAQGTILGIVAGRFLSDHPVSTDRIRQLREYAVTACQARAEMCQREQ